MGDRSAEILYAPNNKGLVKMTYTGSLSLALLGVFMGIRSAVQMRRKTLGELCKHVRLVITEDAKKN